MKTEHYAHCHLRGALLGSSASTLLWGIHTSLINGTNVWIYLGALLALVVWAVFSLFSSLTEEDRLDLVDEWHESDSDLEIHEYLGMTWKEYQRWVRNGGGSAEKR